MATINFSRVICQENFVSADVDCIFLCYISHLPFLRLPCTDYKLIEIDHACLLIYLTTINKTFLLP